MSTYRTSTKLEESREFKKAMEDLRRRALTSGTAGAVGFFGFDSLKNFGAVGNGVAVDTTAINDWLAGSGLKFVPNGDYLATGAVSAFTRPTLILADDASESGTKLPFISITSSPFKNIPKNYVFIQQNNSDRNDEYTFQIQRIVNVDTGHSSPKAFRVVSTNNVTTATANEWAGVFEMVNYGNTTEANLALGMIGRKYGTAPIFAANPIVWDYNKYAAATNVTGAIGMEINVKAVGLDHPTANRSTGNRRALYIVPRTNDSVTGWDVNDGTNYGEGEVGAGIYISNDHPETESYFRYGIVVDEVTGSTSKIGTGIMIRSTGNNALLINGDLNGSANSAAIRIDSSTVFGMLITGTCTHAIRIPSGSYITMDGANSIKTAYGVVANVWGFYAGGTERVGFDMSANSIRVSGTKVLGARETGWTADTGTAKKTANATYSGTASVGYVQAEMQAVMNAVRDATQTIKALKDASITHGWIGT